MVGSDNDGSSEGRLGCSRHCHRNVRLVANTWARQFGKQVESVCAFSSRPFHEDNDNDNDNDTLREVPHWSDEGLALQARVSGPWPHKKESVLQVKLALLARCKNKLLWTECSAQR